MVLQLVRRTATSVARHTGGLLPRLFTLIPQTSLRNGYFLLRYYTLADIFPLGSTIPCVARTFLSPFRDSDRTACYCFCFQFIFGFSGKFAQILCIPPSSSIDFPHKSFSKSSKKRSIGIRPTIHELSLSSFLSCPASQPLYPAKKRISPGRMSPSLNKYTKCLKSPPQYIPSATGWACRSSGWLCR